MHTKSLPVSALLFAALILAAPASWAGRSEPIKNLTDIPLASSGSTKPTVEQVGRAIVEACALRGWACGISRPGEIRAVLVVRKHRAEARIVYTATNYSIIYVSSDELLYNATRKTIHRKYNLWVANLVNDISRTVSNIR